MSLCGSQKHVRPYFSAEQVESLVSKFVDCTHREGENTPAKVLAQFREYVQAPKHNYENNMLRHVLDGTYEVTVKEGRVAYRVNGLAVKVEAISEAERQQKYSEKIDELGKQLNHSMMVINICHRQDRALLSNYAKNFVAPCQCEETALCRTSGECACAGKH